MPRSRFTQPPGGGARHGRRALWRLAAAGLCWIAFAPAFGGLQAQQDPAVLSSIIKGEYDFHELKRLLELARESGFTEEQLKNITVEDESGNTVNAWDFLQEIERRRKEEADRLAAERARVYLTPHDVFKELDGKQRQDIDTLREKMLFDD